MPSPDTVSSRPAAGAATRTIAELPGPRPWPLLGNLPQLDLDRVHQQLERWVDDYGGMYRIRLAGKTIVALGRHDLVSAVLRDRPEGWRRLKKIELAIREVGGHGVFSAEGEDWKRQRRIVMGAFDPGHLKRFFPSLVRVTERLVAQWQAYASSGESFDLQTQMMRYSVDVTSGLAFGADVNTLESPEDPLQAHLDKVFPMLRRRINMPIPYWHWFKLPIDRAFDGHLAKVHGAVRDFIRAAQARMRADPGLRERPDNLIEAMLAAHDAGGDRLTEEELLGNVLTVLLAGEDTTANTLCWAIHLLFKHPHEWRALVAEVDAMLGETEVPRRFDDARGFERIEACVTEAMRLYPVAPVIFHQANHDLVLDGLEVPAGTGAVCLMRRAGVDPQLTGDAAAFRPARWDDGADEAGRIVQKAAMPWGAGGRLCPGRYLALLEMKMVLATLARNFELVEVGVEGGGEPPERLGFTMFPVGLRMRLAPRKRS
jgi:cytochrome P450